MDTAGIALGALCERMGITLEAADVAGVTGRMPVVGNTQPFGALHGGATAVLAETLGSIAANLLAGEGRYAVGIELSLSHHRPVTTGWVHATATALAHGRSFATIAIDVTDDEQRRTASARLTCAFRDR